MSGVNGCGRRRPNPSTCIICQDYLLQYEDGTDSDGGTPSLVPTVATKCGHLFHTACINQWFKTKRSQELKPCPFCKREMWWNDLKRIFPISGEE